MTSVKFEIKNSILNDLVESHKRNIFEVIEILSKHFNFNKEEAYNILDFDPNIIYSNEENSNKTKRPKKTNNNSKIPLPFCGVIFDGCCQAIRFNHGLHTQCLNQKDTNSNLCSTCKKSTNSNGIPSYGLISERFENKDYKDPKGKKTVRYGNIMKKLNISKEQAIEEANKLGLTIPDDEFDVVVGKEVDQKRKVL